MARLVVHIQIDRRREHCRLTGLGQLSTQKGSKRKGEAILGEDITFNIGERVSLKIYTYF